MKGIRGRLTASFMAVIVISVVIMEVLLIYTVQENYYGSLRGSLTSQIKISAICMLNIRIPPWKIISSIT